MTDDQLSRLERLAKLKEQGMINAEEFEKQKAVILGIAPTSPEDQPLATAPHDLSPPTAVPPVGAVEAKPKSNKNTWVLVAFVITFIAILIGQKTKPDPASAPTETETVTAPAETPDVDESTRKHTSDAAGSFIKAATAIKHTLKDPDSYEEEYHQANYVGQNGIYVACLVTYRAKNSYGALDMAKALVTFDESMNVIEVKPVE